MVAVAVLLSPLAEAVTVSVAVASVLADGVCVTVVLAPEVAERFRLLLPVPERAQL